ncbi:hypothetical protein [Flavonifractor sp. HCP28S3_F3]|uniref:hypothetical protein n=1 Tax=Flavonifractor sp. HCP28S3_F3 TaxID=3438939 RepID=UPI003F8C1C2F
MVPIREVSVLDTTLRDGLQHEERYMSLKNRLRLLDSLVEAGVRKIEVGSFAHPDYLPQFREIETFAMMLPRYENVEYTFLALNRRAVERAIKLKNEGAPIHRIVRGCFSCIVALPCDPYFPKIRYCTMGASITSEKEFAIRPGGGAKMSIRNLKTA